MNKQHFSGDVLERNPGLQEQIENAVPASKYKNARTEANGIMFQSKREALGVVNLILLEEQRQIFGLRLQVKFPLPGKITYIADAVYCELKDGKLTVVVEDFKGFRTKEYRIKAKLFKERYGMEIRES